ncbi:MAG TPA: glycosyltransferase [Myxococcota bacterium]|nr:glycosyltransferase [Myxococcota bacterium]
MPSRRGESMAGAQIVIPCFNEAHRLPADVFRAYCARVPDVDFLFVDDGSTDQTLARLRELEQALPGRAAVLALERNAGKAEAVRQGMCAAFKSGAELVGYWDADLATPLEEIARFRAVLATHSGVELVLGARVQLLGRLVRRSRVRHYLGRIFATGVSLFLRLPIYDSQCGAKLMRNDATLAPLFEERFCVNWTFDVELLARLIRLRGRSAAYDSLYELPLERWVDVPGSKVKPGDFFVAFAEIARLWRRYGRGSE